MAEFNPFLPEPNIPDWTNAPGRLIDQSGFGEIFANVAKDVGGYAGDYVDKKHSDDIDSSVRKEWDAARLKEDADKAGLPVDAAKGIDRIKLIHMATAKGGISHTAATAQMEVEVKRLSAKYPGRIDQIQQAYAKATGNTAANALYSEVEAEYARETRAEKDAKDDVEKKWEDLGPFMDGQETYRTDDAPTRAKKEIQAMERRGVKESNTIANSQLALKKANRDDITGEAAPAFVKTLDLELGTVFRGNQSDLIDAVKAANSDGRITPEEKGQLSQMGEDAILAIDQTFDRIRTTPFGPSGQQTTWNEVFANDMKVVEDQAKRLEEYKAQIKGFANNSSGTGFLEVTVKNMEFQDQFAKSEFAKTGPGQVAVKLRAISESFGKAGEKFLETAVDKAFNSPDKAGNTMAKEIANQLKMDSLVPGQTLAGTVDGSKDKPSPSEKRGYNIGLRTTVEDHLTNVKDPSADEKLWEQSAAWLFAPENETFFADLSPVENAQGVSQQELAFQTFTDPKVEAAFKARGKGQQYAEAVTRWSGAVWGSLPEDIRGASGFISGSGNIGTETASVSFNADTMQTDFRIDPSKVKDISSIREFVRTGKGLDKATRANGLSMDEVVNIRDLAKNAQRINLIMKAQAGALRAQGMSDDKILQILQMNLGDLNPGKGSTFLSNLIPMIGQYTKDVVSGKVAKENKAEKDKIRYGSDLGTNPDGTGTKLSVLGESSSFDGMKTAKEKMPVLMTNLQTDLGISDVQAAGIVGNLAHESAGLQPGIAGDSGAAHGWAQWNGPRKKDMIEWTTKQGLDPNTDEANYAYLVHDLKENYPKVLKLLQKADSVEEATWIIEKHYEKPGVSHNDRRLKLANEALQ